jgi:hypothetical protein
VIAIQASILIKTSPIGLSSPLSPKATFYPKQFNYILTTGWNKNIFNFILRICDSRNEIKAGPR